MPFFPQVHHTDKTNPHVLTNRANSRNVICVRALKALTWNPQEWDYSLVKMNVIIVRLELFESTDTIKEGNQKIENIIVYPR
jgi:hypothetical protein